MFLSSAKCKLLKEMAEVDRPMGTATQRGTQLYACLNKLNTTLCCLDIVQSTSKIEDAEVQLQEGLNHKKYM